MISELLSDDYNHSDATTKLFVWASHRLRISKHRDSVVALIVYRSVSMVDSDSLKIPREPRIAPRQYTSEVNHSTKQACDERWSAISPRQERDFFPVVARSAGFPEIKKISLNLANAGIVFKSPARFRPHPADTRRWINVGLTLVQRRGRWSDVKPTLIQRLVSAGYIPIMRFLPPPTYLQAYESGTLC